MAAGARDWGPLDYGDSGAHVQCKIHVPVISIVLVSACYWWTASTRNETGTKEAMLCSSKCYRVSSSSVAAEDSYRSSVMCTVRCRCVWSTRSCCSSYPWRSWRRCTRWRWRSACSRMTRLWCAQAEVPLQPGSRVLPVAARIAQLLPLLRLVRQLSPLAPRVLLLRARAASAACLPLPSEPLAIASRFHVLYSLQHTLPVATLIFQSHFSLLFRIGIAAVFFAYEYSRPARVDVPLIIIETKKVF